MATLVFEADMPRREFIWLFDRARLGPWRRGRNILIRADEVIE